MAEASNIISEVLAEQILDACELKGKKGVLYCIGPYGGRINFSSQQNRALNLVWALRELREFTEGDEIAVIGGGVSGMTLAAGFVGHGCSVDLYETSRRTVAEQRNATHRLIHPTINQWPKEELSLTTTLPFLEWGVGLCSDVTEDIDDQYKGITKNSNLHIDCEVLGIDIAATDRIKLRTSRPISGRPRSYRLAVIAIGFGAEVEHDKFEACSYWEPDSIEIDRDKAKVRHFVVSGCGDGGLIDALRIVHSDFAKGRLVYEIAALLSKTPLAEAIRDGEREALKENSNAGLRKLYGEAVKSIENDDMYSHVRQKLNKSLLKISGLNVYLLARKSKTPYTLRSAPINKLLVAHACRHGAIRFKQGSPSLVGDEIRFAGIVIPAPPDSRVIIRHGPSPAFKNLLGTADIESLRRRQEILAPYHTRGLWSEPFQTPEGIPVRDLSDRAFIESRRPRAQKVIDRIFEDSHVSLGIGHLRVEYPDMLPDTAPSTLFGIPVENTVRPTLPGLLG